jgi:hypothetical protein
MGFRGILPKLIPRRNLLAVSNPKILARSLSFFSS